MQMACYHQSQSLATNNAHENAQTQNRKTTLISALSEATTRIDAQKTPNPNRKKVDYEKLNQKGKSHVCSDHIPSLPFPLVQTRKRKIEKRHLFPHSTAERTRFFAQKT